jgi:hypothetical protein
MAIFDTLSESEVKIFENNCLDSARARKLLNKSAYTSDATNEFATIVKHMIQTALMSKNLDLKKCIELFGKKLSKCYETKLIHSNVAPDFLLLNKNILTALDTVEVLPPLMEDSSGDESEGEQSPESEASPDMSSFGVAMLAETKPTLSRARSPASTPKNTSSSSNQLPRTSSTRTRTPSPKPHGSDRRARSRSPLKRQNPEPCGEKKKTNKRSTSTSSSVEMEGEDRRVVNRSQSAPKRGCPWSQLCFTLQKKIEGKYQY